MTSFLNLNNKITQLLVEYSKSIENNALDLCRDRKRCIKLLWRKSELCNSLIPFLRKLASVCHTYRNPNINQIIFIFFILLFSNLIIFYFIPCNSAVFKLLYTLQCLNILYERACAFINRKKKTKQNKIRVTSQFLIFHILLHRKVNSG